MSRPLLQGELIRLTAMDPESDAEAQSRWSHDDLYDRLSTTESAYPWHPKRIRDELEKHAGTSQAYEFAIRTLDGDRFIGTVELDGILWQHGDCFVGIGIGERDFWGKGYGSDAMNEILRYAFEELNLHRVSLTVFEYNERAIRSYVKVGFKQEGRSRQWLLRDGQTSDVIFMGILRSEWEAGPGRVG